MLEAKLLVNEVQLVGSVLHPLQAATYHQTTLK